MAETESEVVKVAREFRRNLEQNEAAALAEMADTWAKMEKQTSAEMLALAIEIEERTKNGEPIPPQFVYTMERWKRMIEQVQTMRQKYDKTAAQIITKTQRADALLGLSASKAIIRHSKPTDTNWNRINEEAVTYMVGMTRIGTPLYDKLEEDYQQMTPAVMSALTTTAALGKGYKEIAAAMQNTVGMSFERSILIARTETARAYRMANMAQYRASNVVKKVFRLAYKPTACFACLMMDGEEVKGGEFEDHPRGKCTSIVQTTGGIMPTWQTGREWLNEQSEEDQRRIMGAGRFELWKDTGMDPRQMVWIKPNATWGGAPAIRSVEELKQEAELQKTISAPNVTPAAAPNISDPEAPATDEALRHYFGDPGQPMTAEEAATGLNPNFSKNKTFRQNCQRCVPTFWARMKGYDVEALPAMRNHADDFIACNSLTAWRSDKPQIESVFHSADPKTIVRNTMESWGAGSWAQIRGKFGRFGAGHTFTAYFDGNEVVYYDGQQSDPDKAIKYPENYFEHAWKGTVQFTRLDTAVPNNRIFDCCKKKKGK